MEEISEESILERAICNEEEAFSRRIYILNLRSLNFLLLFLVAFFIYVVQPISNFTRSYVYYCSQFDQFLSFSSITVRVDKHSCI